MTHFAIIIKWHESFLEEEWIVLNDPPQRNYNSQRSNHIEIQFATERYSLIFTNYDTLHFYTKWKKKIQKRRFWTFSTSQKIQYVLTVTLTSRIGRVAISEYLFALNAAEPTAHLALIYLLFDRATSIHGTKGKLKN